MLWQKLRRDRPKTLAETIRIADRYAEADPTQVAAAEAPTPYVGNDDAGPSGGQGRPDFRNKRNHDRPAYRYNQVNQVAAVEPDQPDAGNAQRQKHDEQPWAQKKPWEKNAGGGGKKPEWC